MRTAFLFLFIFTGIASFSQSPYLSVRASVLQLNSINYKIEMKLCEVNGPLKPGDVFGKDTSNIDFTSLSEKDFTCRSYWGTDNVNDSLQYNWFDWSNQVFAYEKIIVLKISNISSRDYHKPMYIVLPIKYQSFVTYVELLNIIVKDDTVIYVDNYKDDRTKSGRLQIKLSLANYSALKRQEFPVKLKLE